MTNRDHGLNLILRAASIACLVMALFVAVSGSVPTGAALIQETDNPAPAAIKLAQPVSSSGASPDSDNVARVRRSSVPR